MTDNPRTPTDHRPCRTLEEVVAENERRRIIRSKIDAIIEFEARRREREAKEEGQ